MRGNWNKLFEKKYTIEELKTKYNIDMWEKEKIEEFNKILLNWYDEQKIELPWRRNKNPYYIWVSEVMLQQTRVDTVIPYFESFIKEFPTIEDLARASEDQVLKMWEGLGYYSRARNLKTAAEQIMIHYDGIFPDDPKEIIKLKGIGPYTAGAISSMAFDLPTPAIDGNLMRVLSRLFEIDLDISKAKNRKVFETVALYLIDHDRPGDFNQALMDLGRTICTPRNYFPEQSPVKDFNASYLNDTWQEYPVKKSKRKARPVSYVALALQNEKGEYLIERQDEKGLLANMWLFPLINVEDILTDGEWKLFKAEILEALDSNQKEFINEYLETYYNLTVDLEDETAGVVQHVFSHLIWHLSIYEGKLVEGSSLKNLPENCEWVSRENHSDYAFPTVQKKLWESLQEITLF